MWETTRIGVLTTSLHMGNRGLQRVSHLKVWVHLFYRMCYCDNHGRKRQQSENKKTWTGRTHRGRCLGLISLLRKRSQLRDQSQVKSNDCLARVVGVARLLNQQHYQISIDGPYHKRNEEKMPKKDRSGMERAKSTCGVRKRCCMHVTQDCSSRGQYAG